MAIYCKKLTDVQREWLENYETETTFEPMHQDELDSGEMTFIEVAWANLRWFENWMQETYQSVSTYPAEYVRSGRRNLSICR